MRDDMNCLPWRPGLDGRTIYAVLDEEERGRDLLIGVMDSGAIAQRAVDAHNLLRTRIKEVRDQLVEIKLAAESEVRSPRKPLHRLEAVAFIAGQARDLLSETTGDDEGEQRG